MTSPASESGPPTGDEADALAATVAEHRESDRDGSQHGPDRETEQRVVQQLST